MTTRLTGLGLHVAAPCWSQEAISIFSLSPSTILPSTPAVLRPALTSVTRRSSRFARERSANSADYGPSSGPCPARREDPLPQPPYVVPGLPPIDGVPVQNIVLRSVHHDGVQLAHRFRRLRHQVVTGSPDPRQLPFGPGTSPYPTSYAETIRRRCQSCGPGFLLPFGYRHSLLGSSCARWGIEPSSRSAYRPPPVTGPNGVVVSHMKKLRPGRALSRSGGGGALRPAITFRPSPAVFPRPVRRPAGTSHLMGALSRRRQ